MGALLVAFSASLGFIFLSAVMSDITPVDSQVRYVCTLHVYYYVVFSPVMIVCDIGSCDEYTAWDEFVFPRNFSILV